MNGLNKAYITSPAIALQFDRVVFDIRCGKVKQTPVHPGAYEYV